MGAFSGKSVLVTGGSRGIGRAIAAAFAKAGADVTITARSAESAADAITTSDAQRALTFDIRDGDALRKAVSAYLGDHRVDILVSNAGTALNRSFLKQSEADTRAMLADHVIAPAEIARLCLPGMVERKAGRIINIASTASVKGYAFLAGYVAAKHGLLGLTRALALEFVKSGVTINAICPGFTETDLVIAGMDARAAKEGITREAVLAGFVATKPIGRLIRPEEIASTALWLASDASASITGQAILVDGAETIA